MAKRGKSVKAAEKQAAPAAPAAVEKKELAATLMPAACPTCAGPVVAIREQEEKKVAGATVMAPGEAIGFSCTSESCASFGVPQLFKSAEDEEDEAEEEDLSDLPEILQQAIVVFGLKRDNVLDYKVSSRAGEKKGETIESVVLVTRGGRKLHYPGDEAKAAKLTDAEKDGEQRIPTPRFFPGGLSPRGGAIKG
jgi:hypothetical protein